jgi:hypothetical protein
MDTIDKNVVSQSSESNPIPMVPVKRKRGRPLGSKNVKNRVVTRRAIMRPDGSLQLLGRGRPPAGIDIIKVATQIVRAKRHVRKMAQKHVVAVEAKPQTALELNNQAVARLLTAANGLVEELRNALVGKHVETVKLDSKN